MEPQPAAACALNSCMYATDCVFVRSASAGDAVFYGLATSTPQACDICVYKFLATFLSQLRLFCKPLVGESRLLSDATMSLHHTHTQSRVQSRLVSVSVRLFNLHINAFGRGFFIDSLRFCVGSRKWVSVKEIYMCFRFRHELSVCNGYIIQY